MAPNRGQIAIAPIPGRSGDFDADLAMMLAWQGRHAGTFGIGSDSVGTMRET